MTKYYRGWNKLFNKMSRGRRFKKGKSLDAKEWDSSMCRAMFLAIIWFRIACFNPETRELSAKRLVTLYMDILYTVIRMMNGEVYEKTTGNPSGSENTVVDNTLGLFLVFAYCYIRQCRRKGKIVSYGVFLDQFEGAMYGDDLDITVDDETAQWFSITELKEDAKELGFTFTTENGNDEWDTVEDLVFLSARFHWLEDLSMYVPIPAHEKVYASLLMNSTVTDIRFTLLRAQSLLQDSFWNEQSRTMLEDFIQWVYSENKSLLCDGYIPDTEVDMKIVRSTLLSPSAIRHMYVGTQPMAVVQQL